MPKRLTRIQAQGFRSLADVEVALRPLTVLVGPNGSGKTNVLNVLRFLTTMFRYDLDAALDRWRGFDHVLRQVDGGSQIVLEVEGQITKHASAKAPDTYHLELRRHRRLNALITRTEDFSFKRYQGPGRRITVSGNTVMISEGDKEVLRRRLASSSTTGLATLPKLADDEGGLGIRDFASFLTQILVLEPNVERAREPARARGNALDDDAANLADALLRLSGYEDAWRALTEDVRACLPGLVELQTKPIGGAAREVSVRLVERGLTEPVELADASFGTVRLLALLAVLHDPKPPPFVAIEELDHGLHPWALDVLVDRLRAASERTQLLVTTHSPTLVNRLSPDELVVCDRNPQTGESVIPAHDPGQVAAALAGSDLRAGELWFAGVLDGVPR